MATKKQTETFINEIAPIIQSFARSLGYHVCSPIIAQACCESAYGTSMLGYKYHNYFGMKCGSSWKGKSVNMATREEYTKGVLTNISANFRVYDSMTEGVAGYFAFISTNRYSNLKTAKTPQQYLEMIKADGYATSSSYVNTNMSIIKNYGLDKYDNLDRYDNYNPYPIPTRTLKYKAIGMMKGDDVKWVQTQLHDKGFVITIDGYYGKNTKNTVIAFQKKAFPNQPKEWDGIVGSKTIEKLK